MLLKKNVCRQVDRVVGAIGSFSVDNWVILVAVSAVGIVGYLCYTASLKSVTPTSVSVLRSQEIVLAYFCQVLIRRDIMFMYHLFDSCVFKKPASGLG